MRIIKKILLFIVVVIGIALIAAIFIKKDISITKEVVINKPKAEVFGYIKLIKHQDVYSVWQTMDPSMKKEYKGTDGTVGFISAWDSQNENVGAGEQEIKKIDEGNRIDLELRFKKPYEDTNTAFMTTTAIDSAHTKVEWGFNGRMDYPMNLMLVFMDMQKMIGDDLGKGLENLKVELEK
jgi:hypothetical protein